MTCRWRHHKWRFVSLALLKVRGRLETISYLYRCTRCDSLKDEHFKAGDGRGRAQPDG